MSRFDVRLPELAQGGAPLTRWFVAVGDYVEEDETLLCVSLDDEEAEITAPVAGCVIGTIGEVGDLLPSGSLLVTIDIGARPSEAALPALETAEPPVAGADGNAVSVDLDLPEMPAPFSIDDHDAKLVVIAALPLAPDRIEAVRSFYHQDLIRAWDRFTAELDQHADAVEHARDGAIAAEDSKLANKLGGATQGLRSAEARSEQQRTQRRDELRKRLNENIAAARQIWNRIGRGLELPEPELQIIRRCEADRLDPSFRLDERHEAQARAEELPAFESKSADPFLGRYAWWIGGGALLLGWILFQNFGMGLLFGPIAGIGTYFYRNNARGDAVARYENFVTAIVQDHLAGNAELESAAAELREGLVGEAAATDREKVEAKRVHDATIAGIRTRTAHAMAAAKAHYSESVANCGSLIADLATRLRTERATGAALYDAWSDTGDAAAGAEVPLTIRKKIRIGSALCRPLQNSAFSKGPVPRLTEASPFFWDLGRRKGLLFSDDHASTDGKHSIMTSVLLRLLHQMTPGMVQLTLFDPLGLGRNFAPFLRLASAKTQLTGGRIWSNAEQLRERLRELIEHIERITQILGTSFATIDKYSEAHSDVPEPYRFLALEDFPDCFSEDSARDLARVLQNGPRCGVFVIMHRNGGVALPHGVEMEPLLPHFLAIDCRKPRACIATGSGGSGGELDLDRPPPQAFTGEIVGAFATASEAASDVKVTYEHLLKKAGAKAVWSRDTAQGIHVPLGPVGEKIQHLSLGGSKSLAHHALLVGRPGSGKSNLLHVFITTAARLYSPDELKFYLIDFKQGVEFKPYADAKLPHAHVIALQSEREFGLSVLQGLEVEMGERGKKFAEAGVQNITEYRGAVPGAKMPRIVLVVDEFQQFFVRDDKTKREASVIMGRLVSQARYSGIHLLFGTQSLATATLERAIRDQMTVRIALQCSEADSRLILADDNTEARALTRPGEAIYNSEAGLSGCNTRFQVALFGAEDTARELATIGATAAASGIDYGEPRIFAGHEPGDIERCTQIVRAEPRTGNAPAELKLWLGESTSLKEIAAPPFKRHPGRNLLVLTREEEEGVGVMMAALLSLAVQCPPGQASFQILDLTSADAEWADHPEEFADSTPHRVEVLGRHQARELFTRAHDEVLRRTDAEEHRRGEVERRSAAESAARAPGEKRRRTAPTEPLREPPLFLVILGIHRVRDLRSEGGASHGMSFTDDAPAGAGTRGALLRVLKDGPEVGVHTLIWCDAYPNLERAIDREGMEEFGIKVSGPLSDAESRRLFDDEAAAGIDQPHRMIIGDDDRVGVVQMLRPFGMPSYELINRVAERIAPAASESAGAGAS